jgi:hypothetical protein
MTKKERLWYLWTDSKKILLALGKWDSLEVFQDTKLD